MSPDVDHFRKALQTWWYAARCSPEATALHVKIRSIACWNDSAGSVDTALEIAQRGTTGLDRLSHTSSRES